MKKLSISVIAILSLTLAIYSCTKETSTTSSTSKNQLKRIAFQFGTRMDGSDNLVPVVVNGITYQNSVLTCPKLLLQTKTRDCFFYRELNGDVSVGKAELKKGEHAFLTELVNDHKISLSPTEFFDQDDENQFMSTGKFKVFANQLYEGGLISGVSFPIYLQEGEYDIQPARNSSEIAYIEIPLVY